MAGVLAALKRIFKGDDETIAVVTEPTSGLDISEPIITFVQLVKDNPKRFELELVSDVDWHEVYNTLLHCHVRHFPGKTFLYRFKDKEASLSWSLQVSLDINELVRLFNDYTWTIFLSPMDADPLAVAGYWSFNESFLTWDEAGYIRKELQPFLRERLKMKRDLDAQREAMRQKRRDAAQAVKDNATRQHYIEIYCKKEA